ncbi:MAG: PP2C family protein-serine/threonine phosphatase [Eubacteriales bacterium]
MDARKNIFIKNEQQANVYVARCLIICTGLVLLIWFLNVIEVFKSDLTVVNIVMPTGVFFLVVPAFLILKKKANGFWVKYLCVSCFTLGMGVLYTGLTFQAVLAWILPIALSRHYYSKKVINFTLITSLVIMLVTIYLGAFFGVSDANMIGSVQIFDSLREQIDFTASTIINGHSIYYRIFVNFYLPRAFILIVAYVISLALSERTHSILQEQEKDLEEKKRISDELAVATEIQTSMLPNVFPAFPHRHEFDIYAMMTPSKEVSGDFYDFFFVDEDHLAMVIADVSGKGVPAALFMMSTKIIINNLAQLHISPAEILFEANNQLCDTNENDMFVSVWLGIYEISSGKLTACNAGHEYPILKQTSGDYTLLKDKHDLVLGAMEDSSYNDYEIQLGQDDVLFIYTDGIPEAIDKDTQAYGTDRLLDLLNKEETLPLHTMLHTVTADVQSFAGDVPQFDDMTMLAVKITSI